MGCYDTILVKCPHCGDTHDFQTKSGDCLIRTYQASDQIPDDVLLDGNRHAPSLCSCGSYIYLAVEDDKVVAKSLAESQFISMAEARAYGVATGQIQPILRRHMPIQSGRPSPFIVGNGYKTGSGQTARCIATDAKMPYRNIMLVSGDEPVAVDDRGRRWPRHAFIIGTTTRASANRHATRS